MLGRRITRSDNLSGKKRSVEALWWDLFSNTSVWWDHRPEKINPRFPDFKHKQTQEALWLVDDRNPPWVQAKLDEIPLGTLESNVFAWTQRLKRHVKAGHYKQALEVFHQMQQERICADRWTFLPVLNACAGLGALEEGRHIHKQIIRVGCMSDVYVATCLVDMYAKCGSVEDAWNVFNQMPEPDVATWSAMIGGFAKSGQGLKAIELFRRMQQVGMEPNAATFVGLLNACASASALEEGRGAHEQIVQRGFNSDVHVANCLVDMYAKCGSMEDAWNVFNNMWEHDVVSWNAIIMGYVKSGQGLKAMKIFQQMGQEGVEPDTITFIGLLSACASVAALGEGRRVHGQIIQRGCESNVCVANCLVNMYIKCGSIEDARSVFNNMTERDLISWSAMIWGYVKLDQGLKAMELFQEMQQEGVEPNTVTFVGVLNGCSSVAALEEGRRVHEQIVRRGCQSNINVANCLVDMYAKCGSIEDAWSVFSKMRERDVVSWSAMIQGYVKSKHGLKAIELFREMQQEGVEPNTVTFLVMLNACASVAALEEGRQVHEQIIQRGYESDVYVATCLVDMYAKCGSIEDAWSVFNNMQERNVVSWNAMIGSYAMHGHSQKAIGLFKRMIKEGVKIDQITFTCLLSACNHGGLVKEGLRYFNSMTLDYNVLPTREHYACTIDLLGRAGQLEEAENMTKKMPMLTNHCVWMSLLGSCRIHGNIGMAERAANRCWELDPDDVVGYVLLSNIYAAARNWNRSSGIGKVRSGIKSVQKAISKDGRNVHLTIPISF